MPTEARVAFSGGCPVPFPPAGQITMAHGGGGRLTQQLLDEIFLPAFDNPVLGDRHDGATLQLQGQRIAFTTDSYVVRPLFFPGGDIGKLAVCGTVNDLAMCGARPRWLSAGFIIEEGLPMELLRRVVNSMRMTAAMAGVQIVTGDTKVVDRGKGDQLYINTSGIGLVDSQLRISPAEVRPDDVVIVSGDLGRHGMAIMSVREGLEFETRIESDCAPLVEPVAALMDSGIKVHCLRDLTRGGLATTLNEIATAARWTIEIDEAAIPVSGPVRGACEILGLDPLYVANEGTFVALVAPDDADLALQILRRSACHATAERIGRVVGRPDGELMLRCLFGGLRPLDLLTGEQLPRIC